MDLEEAWEIAERGPMPLFQADIQLTRARLFRDRAALEEARRLIEKHGYHRRDGELADALEAAKGWGPATADEDSAMILERRNGSGAQTDAGHSSREIPEPELSIDQLLEQLKQLPAAQFEELVFRYDSQNSVPGRPEAQSVRAIELLKVMRNLEGGLATLQSVLQQLRRGGIP